VVTTSPTVLAGGERPIIVSTSGAVLLAGGLNRADGRPSSEVQIFDRAARSWRQLLPLPAATYVLGGAAVGDVPYVIGARCADHPDGAMDVTEDCTAATIYRLVDDAKEWQALTPPDGMFRADGIGGFGALGDHSLAFMSNAAPYTAGIIVLDLNDDSWSKVPLPQRSAGRVLIPCFTKGVLHLRTVGVPLGTGESSTDGPKPYAFQAWARSGSEWLGPEHVDLGPVIFLPVGAGGTDFCSNGRFVAANGDRTISLSVKGSQLHQSEIGVLKPGRGPELASVSARISPAGEVVWVDKADAIVRSPAGTADPLADHLYVDETDHSFDLLECNPSSDRVSIITVGKN